MKKCSNCGAQITDNSRFCSECGKEITQANVCPHCGASMNDGDVFCQNCGKKPTDTPIEANEAVYEGEKKSGFKKYLPYIIGAVVVLAIIGYFNSKDSKGGGDAQTVAVDTMAVDSVASADEAPSGDKNRVIANYDEGMIYQGEYVFDAVLTDATLEKKNVTFTIKIDGNKVSIPSDEKTMTGYIYSDDLGIGVVYDYGDDMHYISMQLTPNDKEGKEWVGEYHPTGILYNVVMKLKECKQQGEAIKVTKERDADDDNETTADDNTDNSSSTSNSSNTSSYSKYVGKWILRKTTDGGNRMRIEVTLKDNKSGENVVFAEHGNRAEVLVYEEYQQCILNDGIIYMTKDGDINGKGVPKLRVASDGLYSFSGEKYTRKLE